ncbi:phosphatidylinositol mannoside acyltransferase [Marihabitans asiaticum]|uniref:KDO2-lipid IV(A) lauroyltransferase n=1 Tax=Marihabitans asiaticum TaxID=415218 RepID=A0A560W6R0_9MICO|nr:phosphatidylinositol mannoside acyltransferase [Marihabitans asiaticum]TWD13299.1 KDO2-lipid IV(A) lauroyltransferase [Marihabitans asiaticum]
MRDRLVVLAFRLGWALVRYVPERLMYAAVDRAARVVHRRGGEGVEQLRRNYARVRPDLGEEELDRVTGEGVRSAFRYYAEAFRLPALTGADIDEQVRFGGPGAASLRADLDQGRPVLCFLGHLGNWDLAGAWCARHLGHVVTVAERLRPEEMFEAFLAFREGELGMTIYPAAPGTLDRLREQLASGEPVVMPLLADRDLSAKGVEVDLCGHRARVAAGPAILAVETGLPVYVVSMWHERRGRRWGMDIEVGEPVRPAPGETREEAVVGVTQRSVDQLGRAIAERPADWHMMQRVFLSDLDADRLARARGEAA